MPPASRSSAPPSASPRRPQRLRPIANGLLPLALALLAPAQPLSAASQPLPAQEVPGARPPATQPPTQPQSRPGAGTLTPSSDPAAAPAPPAPPQAPAAVSTGGVIRGTVKAGAIPLPGVAITATNTLTGSKYATTSNIDGVYVMAIPKSGRYVIKAQLAAFASATAEVKLTSTASDQTAPFALELASRVAEAAARATGASTGETQGIASALARGTQSLSISGAEAGLTAAGLGDTSYAASLPSLANLGGAENQAASADAVTVSGREGSTNGLASFSEDELRDRIERASADARQHGGPAGSETGAIVSLLGGLMGGPGGGPGGGGRGGRGGFFRNFNPTQPHGSIFYQGGFSALDAQPFSLLGTPTPKQGSYQNRFGISFAGSPYIPGLFKPSTRQFVFLNLTGARNLNPLNFYGTVPTALERAGDFSHTVERVNGVLQPDMIYDPATGLPYPNSIISSPLAPQATALLNYYPQPTPGLVTTQGYNYQNVTTQGSNTTNLSARFVRNFGAGGFGHGGFGGGRGGGANAPKTLRQNLNSGFSYSHSASDNRNIIPILGGKIKTDGYSLSTGYSVGYGAFNNNFSVSWNRSHATTLNYFTGSAINPAAAAGISVPSQAAGIAQAGFYNGVPNISVTNFTSLNEQTPRDLINQTISFSDGLRYRLHKHNLRFGVDVRRVHADQLGGNNVVGTFAFSGLVTESPADRALTLDNSGSSTSQPTTGSALADFLLGQPQQSRIQAGLFKTYLRENVFDAYAQDDFRVASGITLNYGLRWEYFSPYVEKNNRLVNLDHNPDFTSVTPVQPGQKGPFGGSFPRSLVNPDRTLFAPRVGFAWRPKFIKQTVLRGGYGIDYNTGQFAVFAQSLAFQPPFAITQNNVLATSANLTGCRITTPGSPTNLTLASGFGCSDKPVQNTYAVNKNYRLGNVQVYSLDLQRTLGLGVVLNLGYNGSRGSNLDIVRAPNTSATSVTTPAAQAFTYEDSVAESRNNQLVVSARKRLQKGVELEAVYQYGHSIDNASSIGASGSVSEVQDDRRLDLEEGNSSFDVRHKLSGNFLYELPFGPNRAYLSRGGLASKLLDGFGLSGNFTFASGTYFTPTYLNSTAQIAAGGTYTLRPDRVFTQSIAGPRGRAEWFNKAAFTAPANGFGTASRNSIEGPGIVSIDMALSRTVQFGETRSFEARAAVTNVFNTVQYSSIDTTIDSAAYGSVTGTAAQRRITFIGRFRF